MHNYKAKSYLCVAATLQKVIFDLRGILLSQEEIANYFGVCYPKNEEIDDKVENSMLSEDPSQ